MLLGGPFCERAETGTILTGSLFDVDTLRQLAGDQNCGFFIIIIKRCPGRGANLRSFGFR